MREGKTGTQLLLISSANIQIKIWHLSLKFLFDPVLVPGSNFSYYTLLRIYIPNTVNICNSNNNLKICVQGIKIYKTSPLILLHVIFTTILEIARQGNVFILAIFRVKNREAESLSNSVKFTHPRLALSSSDCRPCSFSQHILSTPRGKVG